MHKILKRHCDIEYLLMSAHLFKLRSNYLTMYKMKITSFEHVNDYEVTLYTYLCNQMLLKLFIGFVVSLFLKAPIHDF